MIASLAWLTFVLLAERLESSSELDADVAAAAALGCHRRSIVTYNTIAAEARQFYAAANVTVYPWALTMVSALRFGGTVVDCDGESCMGDHDIDFMLVKAGGQKTLEFVQQGDELARRLAWRFFGRAYVTYTPRWMWSARTGYPENLLKDIFCRVYIHPMIIIVGPWTPMGAMKIRFFKHYLEQAVNRTGGSFLERTVVAIFNGFPRLMETIANRVTVVDLWHYTHTKLQNLTLTQVEPHPRLTVSWEGVGFAFPRKGERVLAESLASVVWRNHRSEEVADKIYANLRGFCDMSIPHNYWPEDGQMAIYKRKRRMLWRCHSALRAAGRHSFGASCRRKRTAVPHNKTRRGPGRIIDGGGACAKVALSL